MTLKVMPVLLVDLRVEPVIQFVPMKRFCTSLLILIVALICLPAMAQQTIKTPTCGQSALLDSVTASTRLVLSPANSAPPVYINGVATANPNGARLHICTVTIIVKQDVAAATFGLIYGTGAACATGKTNLTPQYIGTASVIDKYQERFGSDAALAPPAGNDVCLALSATPVKAQVLITYGVY